MNLVSEFRQRHQNPWLPARNFLSLALLGSVATLVALLAMRAHGDDIMPMAVKAITFVGAIAFGHWFARAFPAENSLRTWVAALLAAALAASSWGVEYLLMESDVIGPDRALLAIGRGLYWWASYLLYYAVLFTTFKAAAGLGGASRGKASAWGVAFLLVMGGSLWLQVRLLGAGSGDHPERCLLVVLGWGALAGLAGVSGVMHDRAVLLLNYEEAIRSRRGRDTRLGQIALESGLLTEPQINRAIAIQEESRRNGRPHLLGRILVAEGLITEEALTAILDRQKAEKALAGFVKE